MSKILSGIGKVFKKIVKVAKVVLPIALAAAAVVFTGGAALGILPTFAGAIGSVVGGLGLSAGLATALTGAVVGAGFGAAAGGVVGGLSGGGILKGMQTGALTGAVTGGLMPGAMPGMGKVIGSGVLSGVSNASAGLASVGPSFAGAVPATTAVNAADLVNPGVASALGGSAAPAGGLLTSAAPSFASAAAPTIAAPSVASAVVPTIAAAAPASAGSAGLTGGLLSNPMNTMMLGNMVTGLFTPSAAQSAAQAEKKIGDNLFSGTYTGAGAQPSPYGYNPPSNLMPTAPKRYRLNRTTMKVEEVKG